MVVSTACRSFIDRANRRDWRAALLHLNGLSMYELVRSIKALDPGDFPAVRTMLTSLGGAVNGPRINYALSVVVDGRLPATAPGDLQATGQVAVARQFLGSPLSILTERMPAATVTGYNVGLTSSSNATMQARFGAPRSTYSQVDQPITNAALAARMVRRSVGPFVVRGLDSAVTSLSTIMTAIALDQRLVYRVLEPRGMLVVRYVRGSTTNVSNHSWGTAIDLAIEGVLDNRGDNVIQFGLQLISGIFNLNGWYWGAGFPTEDAQHFEVGSALVQTY